MPSLPAFPSPEFRRSRARACVAAAQIDVATAQLCPLGRQAMIGLARAELHRGTSIEQLCHQALARLQRAQRNLIEGCAMPHSSIALRNARRHGRQVLTSCESSKQNVHMGLLHTTQRRRLAATMMCNSQVRHFGHLPYLVVALRQDSMSIAIAASTARRVGCPLKSSCRKGRQ